jgi:hypothetical protein
MQIAIRDERRDRAPAADVADDLVELGMQQRPAAAQRHDAGAQVRQSIDAPKHVGCRNRRGVIVELVAVRARQVASTDRDKVAATG